MQDKLNEKIVEIFKKCLELNSDNFHVFLDYSGHVDKIDVRVIKGGYKSFKVGESFDEKNTIIRISNNGDTSSSVCFINTKLRGNIMQQDKYIENLDKVMVTLERLSEEVRNIIVP
ncbi:MAG: hypothetical protein ACRC0V_06635 [Fusobacteriaceae bacterium]